VSNLKLTFQGLDANAELAAIAERSARELGLGKGVAGSLRVTFEAPPAFAPGDELWLHLETTGPGGGVWVTRTLPKRSEYSLEDFVRRSFASVARSLRPRHAPEAIAPVALAA
jgi:hypothetical protein